MLLGLLAPTAGTVARSMSVGEVLQGDVRFGTGTLPQKKDTVVGAKGGWKKGN
jgi:hypothetical protein